MSHIATTLVLHCMDFRFIDQLHDWLNAQGLKNQYDLVSVAGAVKNLVDPTAPTDREFILRQIKISKELHDIKEVWLINHRDCGGYRGYQLAGEQAEREFHRDHLARAKDMVTAAVPDVAVKKFLVTLLPDQQIKVEIVA